MELTPAMEQEMETPRALQPKMLFYAVGFVLLLSVAFALFGQNEKELLGWLQYNQTWLQEEIAARPVLGALSYILLFTLVIGFYIPGGLLLLLMAGALFPVWEANFYANIGNMLGALIGFFLARYFLREEIQSCYGRRLRPINEGIRHAGWLYLLVLRIAPVVPSPVINFGMGLTHISAWVYAVVTLLGRIPMTALYVNLGVELSEIDELGDLLSAQIMGTLLLIALVMLGGHFTLQHCRNKRRAAKAAA